MSNIALHVEDLSKQYRIGRQEHYRTFRDAITDAATGPFRRAAGLLRGNSAAAANLTEMIWALKDISFEIKHGDVVGIIGGNGAGKSTLLKILSRITEPTTGYADVFGRVGALLEVGTGFHPELTGRENIFLNGAILGMSREEIKRKFDEIIDFAGVEKFIDTPVKHYSSGMGLRLGFAVAANLEPEILVIDEVLAVGDAEFQKKCMGKMSDVAGEGRTVLFVSHNMAAIQALCSYGIWLEQGKLKDQGHITAILQSYLEAGNSMASSMSLQAAQRRQTSLQSIIQSISLTNALGETTSQFNVLDLVVIGVEVFAIERLRNASLGIGIDSRISGRLVTIISALQNVEFDIQGRMVIRCVIRSFPLVPGVYSLKLALSVGGNNVDIIEDAVSFEVIASDVYGTGKLPHSGSVVLKPEWDIQPVELTPYEATNASN